MSDSARPHDVGLDCAAAGKAGVSCCRQSETAATDLNAAVRRYRASRVVSGALADTRRAMFGDFSDRPDDFLQANLAVINARQCFAGLPARIRERFGNDPVALLTFLADGANRAEAVALGLINEPAPPAPMAGMEPAGPESAV